MSNDTNLFQKVRMRLEKTVDLVLCRLQMSQRLAEVQSCRKETKQLLKLNALVVALEASRTISREK